jgi:hypothetical protein
MRERFYLSAKPSRTLFLVALALVAVGVACDENLFVPPPPPVTPPALRIVVEWQHPMPQGNDLFRMWGFPDGTFYAVGEAGTLLHHDGSVATLVDTPTREDLRGIWAGGPDDIYACGFNGTLIHFDGSEWTSVDTPIEQDLYAVWASSSDDVFVAGMGGSAWNLSNGTWTEYAVVPGRRLHSLWGYTHDEVYVGGSMGALYRFDGSAWTRMIIFGDPAIDAEIYDLWGPAPGSISLVDRWNILWFNGSTWNGIGVVQSNGLGLWGFTLNQQVAVSDQVSTHWVGGQRTFFTTPTIEPLFDVWGTSMSNLYAVGRSGSIAHFDGAAWEALNQESLVNLHDVWVSPTSDAVAVGTGGTILRQNGSDWIQENVGATYELAGVWETPGLAVAVGRYAPNNIDWQQAILMNTGSGWTDVGPVGSAHRLFDVWGSSASDVYAVGWAGEILHYDGGWSVVDAGDGDAAFLMSISGTTAGNVFAVGRTDDLRALVCHFDGMTWTKNVLGGVEELRGVWADGAGGAFAVGSAGSVRRYAGGTWASMKSATTDELFCVWGASATDVYAAGWQGALVHYDGTSWRKLLPATNRSLNAISGRSASEVYLAGDKGSILLFEGL